MLLFIGVKVSYPSGRENFNTSHVTVYLTHYQTGISITIFQYISCYCLSISKSFYNCFLTISIHLMLLFINNETAQVAQEILFQYISCYCLSPSGCTTLVAVAPFQYISCYCLSVIRIAIAGADGYFNTSHVTVYRRYREPASNIVTDFNTSHVTVYHIRSIVCTTLYHISIHLMLLFIPKEKQDNRIEQIFQYISCYCLSDRSESATVSSTDISIHLMLLFITANIIQIYIICQISIHLMLLFIQKEKRQWRTWIYFNTSHVTVYQQISVFDSSGVTHFNTSHVTVYHVAHGGYNAACLFQYISCYCLSLLVDSLPCPDHISIHLMLLFIA